jgi:hypothetical protein
LSAMFAHSGPASFMSNVMADVRPRPFSSPATWQLRTPGASEAYISLQGNRKIWYNRSKRFRGGRTWLRHWFF